MKRKIAAFLIATLSLLSVFGCEKKASSELSLRKLDMSKYVTLGEYKGVEVEYPSVEVSEEEIEERMFMLIKSNLDKYGVTDRGAKEGDRIVVNLKCYEGGVAISEVSVSGETFVIGDKTMQEDIEKAFIDMKAGENKNIETSYPADYIDQRVAGKDVTLRLELVSIYPDKITDEMVKGMDSMLYTDVASLHDYLDNNLKKSTESDVENSITLAILKKVYDSSEVTFPENYLEDQKKKVEDSYAYQAGVSGLSVDEYVLATYGLSLEELAEKLLKQRMIIEAIAQKEGVSFTDKSYKKTIEDAAKEQGMDVETYFLINNLKNDEAYVEQLTSQKVCDILYENAIITGK